MSEVKASEVGSVDTQILDEVSRELGDEIRKLQSDLLNLNTKLVFEVATCDCVNKEECPLYNISREIAKVLKELQEVATNFSKKRVDKAKGKKR